MRVPILLLATVTSVFAADPAGIRPLGPDGQPLNLNFEAGSLKDWTATGDAFAKQPMKGPIDKNRPYGADKFSNHQGDFWIGGFEILRDEPKGTLTSAPFKVTQPWASFLIGGGALAGTRVEIVTKDDGKVIETARGANLENMTRSIVDLRKYSGREIFIRLVDEESPGWGHVNFDDFVFHDAPPKFAAVTAPTVKVLTGEESVKLATVPAGFELKLFAAEPDIVNPISFCIDDRGRLWVAEGHTYPTHAKDGEGQDRIVVFEDTDGDGKADKRTVFMEKLNLVSGLEYGFGGLWVGAAPYLMFIPIADGEEPKPAGEPKILLDGWGYQDTHETLNTFRWGPDGWLYGSHGVFTSSKVGKPGTPDADRVPINAGFWRYHPKRNEFEIFAHGTSNSWGFDFDEHGQCFAEACVIPHLFHIAQGGRYQRQAGEHFNKNTYDDIKTIADHRHYVGDNPHGGNGKSDSTGGGHAHAGLVIPQGAGWPETLTGKLVMGNIHGQRVNMDIPVRAGSGYIGKHGEDLIVFNDPASQVVDMRQGPNGSVFFIDWYDTNQCHRTQREAHDYTTGRIYKLVPTGSRQTVLMNLTGQRDSALAELALSPDIFVARNARRLLQEKGSAVAVKAGDPASELRALWARHATGTDEKDWAQGSLGSPDEYVRAWAIQLACEKRDTSAATREKFAQMAKDDKSPVVRLYLASAAQRLSVDERKPIVEALITHGEDAGDVNLPLMYWYALEPVVGANPAAAAALLGKVKIPILQEYIARRMAATAQLR